MNRENAPSLLAGRQMGRNREFIVIIKMLIGLVPSLLHAKYNIRLFFSLIIVENLNSRKMYEVEFPSHFSTSSESFLNMIPGLFLSSFLFLPMLIYLCGVLVFLPILILFVWSLYTHICADVYLHHRKKRKYSFMQHNFSYSNFFYFLCPYIPT